MLATSWAVFKLNFLTTPICLTHTFSANKIWSFFILRRTNRRKRRKRKQSVESRLRMEQKKTDEGISHAEWKWNFSTTSFFFRWNSFLFPFVLPSDVPFDSVNHILMAQVHRVEIIVASSTVFDIRQFALNLPTRSNATNLSVPIVAYPFAPTHT